MGLLQAVLARMFPPATESIAEISLGRRVVVQGRVVARDLIESPLTEKRCVYYRYLVERWQRESASFLSSTGIWMVIDKDEAISEFYVDDGTGRALVVPVRAIVEVPRVPGDRVDPGGRVDLGDSWRAHEVRFTDGDWVEIEAVVHESDDLLDEARGYREHPTRRILQVGEGDVMKIRVLPR